MSEQGRIVEIAAMRRGRVGRDGRRTAVFSIVLLCAALGACATQPSIDALTSEPVIVTKYDTQIAFGSFDTFAINPTVSIVRDVGDAGTLSPEKAATLTERVAANMSSRGYRAALP